MVKKIIKAKAKVVKKTQPKPKQETKGTTQSQSQHITISLSKQPATKKVVTEVKNQQPRYLPMMPSFNINQPQQSSDLAKLIGFLIPKLQTNSTLANAIPVKDEIPETQKPVDIGGLKNSKEQPTLGVAIESAVIPPSSLEQKQMANEDMLSILTQYPKPSKENDVLKAEIPLEIKTRRNKQQMDEARQMGREDINSIQLGLSRFNYTPPMKEDNYTPPIKQDISEISTEKEDISEISTEPLYEGGREAKPKRPYVRSGIYAGVAQKRKEKANAKKQFSEYQKE